MDKVWQRFTSTLDWTLTVSRHLMVKGLELNIDSVYACADCMHISQFNANIDRAGTLHTLRLDLCQAELESWVLIFCSVLVYMCTVVRGVV